MNKTKATVATQRPRSIILHFHTYKNAGSTVDALLRSIFSEAWRAFDFHAVPEFFISHSELVNIAQNRPTLRAISSHQIRLPVPETPNIEFLPIVFIRHPILRAASLWRYERMRDDNHPRTLLAKERSFCEWLTFSLESRHADAFCNVQTFLFSFGADQRSSRQDPLLPERAAANIAALPFIGVVEEFDRSMKIFEQLYAPRVPDFRIQEIGSANVTGDTRLTASEQLDAIHEEVGDDIFNELVRRNQSDLDLHEAAKRRALDFALADEPQGDSTGTSSVS